MLYSIVGLLVIIVDQAVKYWVANTLFGQDIVRFIPGLISLVNVHNDGCAFSFLSGSGARIYFIIATGVFAVLVVIALATDFISGRLARWSLVLVTAGGLANMIDRVIYGYVQDMFKVEIFNFAIFNVADVFITVFSIVFALAMIFEKPEPDEDEGGEEPEDEDDEEEEKPSRRRLRGKKKEPAEEYEEAAPEEKKQPRVSAAKKARQEKYEAEYEQYKAKQQVKRQTVSSSDSPAAAAMRQQSANRPAQPQGESDPFAAWEAANARVDEKRGTSYAGKAMGSTADSAARPSPAKPSGQRRAAAPEAPAARPARPAPAPKAEEPEEVFSLEDILNEFK